ncbi:MAG: EscU/YscU/HrcU family type III secretion system export apparatus switch protein [Polyangiaceae bacterium]|nr:EscU/YscU/HrcU family type III secretion system export apparatus switch protein [Polyangiaceae bacterium]
MTDKTEEPTPRRLRKAREDGDAGVSVFAAQSLALVVAAVLAPAVVRATAARATADLHGVLGGPPPDAAAAVATALSGGVALSVVGLVAPLLGVAAATSALAQALQSGGVVTARRLAPKIDRLDPIAGLRGLLSLPRIFAVVRALATAALVAWLAWLAIAENAGDLARTAGRPAWLPQVIAATAGVLVWRAALAGLALAVVDLLVTRRAWTRRLRMTKAEVRREHRDAEGDPQLKAARERAHHELLAQATLAAVKKASVVVVNPVHIACALRYDAAGRDEAPVVVTSGRGDAAAAIVRAARDYGVPVVRDVPLARALSELADGEVIPEALYEAVAAILVEVSSSPA